jgi:hypothetical protein
VDQDVEATKLTDGSGNGGTNLLVVRDVTGEHAVTGFEIQAKRAGTEVPRQPQRRRAERSGAARDQHGTAGER